MCDRLIHTREMTHPHVWHDSFICVTWLIHMCDMTPDICVTWLIHMCDVTHSCVTWLTQTCDVTHSYVSIIWNVIQRWRMGWLRLVGSLKSYVSFAKEPCKRDDILQKRRMISRSLLIVATPYLIHMCDMTHLHMWCDSFVCVTCHIESCHTHTKSRVFGCCKVLQGVAVCCIYFPLHLPSVPISVTLLIHKCDMTHSYVWHDSFICVTWLIHMCDMTPSHVWHDSFLCMTWLLHMCDMTHQYVWHDSSICVARNPAPIAPKMKALLNSSHVILMI